MAAATPIRIAIDDLGAHIATLKSELEQGHTIDLVRDDIVIAEICVSPEVKTIAPEQSPPFPDFMARLREMYPDGPVSIDTTAIIREDRDSRG